MRPQAPSTSSCVGPSAITRTSSSVPEVRTRTRPQPSSWSQATGGERLDVPTVGIQHIDAEDHLAIGQAPGHIDAYRDRERSRRAAGKLRHDQPVPAAAQQIELAAYNLRAVSDEQIVEADLVGLVHRLTSRRECHTVYDASYTNA
jgi:hypothetical protein